LAAEFHGAILVMTADTQVRRHGVVRPAPAANVVFEYAYLSAPTTTTPRGRIGRCGYARRARHRRFPSRSMAGSGVDRSWADSSTSTRGQHETADQIALPRSETPQVSELEQFALQTLVSPGRILSGQAFDQGGEGGVDGRAAACVRVGPFLGYQVNADGLRLTSGRAGRDPGRGSAVGAGRWGCRRGGSGVGSGRASR
jgi:hypothetical protein